MNTLTPRLADADWGNYLADRTFTGRRVEMDQLSQELLSPEAKAVAIVGEGGIGKTTLAMMFGRLNRDFFSAGVYHVSATRVESLARTVDARVSNPSKPYLLLLDDVEMRPAHELGGEIQELRKARPSARLICISRRQFLSGEVDLKLQIQLRGFNQSELSEFLEKFTPFAGHSGSSKEIFEVFSSKVLEMPFILDLLKSGRMSPREVLHRLRGFSQSGIVDAYGVPVVVGDKADREIIIDVTSVNDQLLKHVHSNPNLMYELTPRKFEEFVAEVLERLGYAVTLTPPSRDGGKDIYAAKKDHLGSFLYLVECKKFAPDNTVGVGLIRQLNGVVQAEGATAGILATTSFFTKGAKDFQQRISHQMGLKDFLGIQEWLQDVFRQ